MIVLQEILNCLGEENFSFIFENQSMNILKNTEEI